MKRQLLVLLSILLLIAFSPACTANEQSIVSNLRTALDKDGRQPTSTFSGSDVIYLVTDVANAPRGTKLEVKWIAVNVVATAANHEFDSQIIEITEETFTGTTYFQLSNAIPWPVGQYRADLYVNDALAESVEFRVQ